MPKVPSRVLDCVCYLYSSEADAREGANFGGTGFLVATPSIRFPKRGGYVYVVTNWHVACRDGASVVRVNTHDGSTDIYALGPEDWDFLPEYDIAVASIVLKRGTHRYALLGLQSLLSKNGLAHSEIGPGDDVFMIGRFVDHDGGSINRPALRFGNISINPTPILQPNGRRADSFCVDMHSRTGYSGSPVFVYRTPGSDLTERLSSGDDYELLKAGANLFVLLGIHWGQFPERWEIAEEERRISEEAAPDPLIVRDKYIEGLSGMTCVLPAWSIAEVLNMPKLREQRAKNDEAVAIDAQHKGKMPKL